MILSTCRKPSCLFAAKNSFILHALLEILQRCTNFLFWVLWSCLVAHTQNDSINLYKTLMFICMQKTNFIIHFFLEILHFKESCNLIGWQHRELEFCQIWDWWWNISNKISFQFRFFPRKLMTKFFKKSKKNLFWGNLGSFTQIWAKMNFPGKKSSVSF